MPGMIQSVERSSAVLRLLAAGPGRLRVKEVADALGLPKSTAHSILRTLEHVGFAEQDPRTARYRLGRGLLELGRGGLDVNELRSRALDWADALASRTVESVRIGVLDGTPARDGRATGSDGRVEDGAAVKVIHHVFRPDDTAQSMEIGLVVPAHATALGKVLLAYDAPAAEAAVRGGLDPYTRKTLTHRRDLAAALAEIRGQGWGSAIEEWEPGRAGIAAPTRGIGGLVVGAIGIYGPVERVCDSRLRPRTALVAQVRATAESISRDLSGPRS
ncbi:IclR family transcriptional regulator [Paractinoplanes atraurantiacus]|uniref:IclR family transcriptional regulator n=1 Tax=Paractinoplanes atraurantiacus TaxID=1036182 RepID=UPI000BE39192|nr:IclR family transcriptional regulator [Actinoplanes atraurantiacus]